MIDGAINAAQAYRAREITRHRIDVLLCRLRIAGHERCTRGGDMGGRGVGIYRLPGLLRAKLFSRGVGGLSLANGCAEGNDADQRDAEDMHSASQHRLPAEESIPNLRPLKRRFVK